MTHSLDLLNRDLEASKSDRVEIHNELKRQDERLDKHSETFGKGFEPTTEEIDILVESMPNEYFSSVELDQQAMFRWMYRMMKN